MAAEVAALPNGNYAPHAGYGAVNQSQNEFAYTNNAAVSAHSAALPASSTPANALASQQQQPVQSDISKDEVGWYFVEQYYTTLSRSPERLYLFYNKRSQFVSGVEADKVSVCVGQRSINDRIKDLDFQDCKVRVTNVDSQASDQNIVIQVIGEISNKGHPHKKFTQTFVLATQTNGYFVLNDIFRYLVEEEDEPEQESAAAPAEEVQQVSGTESGDHHEPAPTQAEPKTLATSGDAVETDAWRVDKELEEKAADRIASSEDASAAAVKELVNGEGAEGAKKAVEEATAIAPAEAEPETPAPAPTAELERTTTAEADVQPEKPKDPEPTPVASPPKQAIPQSAPPPKPAAPAVPMSWAARAAAASASRAPAATPAVPQQPAAKSTGPKTATPSSTQASTPPTSSAPSAPSAPTAPAAQRQEQGSDSQDEWTAVGHSRQQSRQTNAPQQEPPQQNRGYVKNVHENVDAAELRKTLEQFGEIVYFDIARQKNCAFVDFKTADAYNKAVESPFQLAGEKLYVEERRIRPGSTPYVPRGQFQGGRGGRGGAGQGPPRGGFQGNRGGAGGAPRGRGGFAPPGTQRGGRGGSLA